MPKHKNIFPDYSEREEFKRFCSLWKRNQLDTNSSNKTEKTSRQQQTPAPMESSFKSEAELSELKIRLRDALSIGSHFQEQYKEEKHSRKNRKKGLKNMMQWNRSSRLCGNLFTTAPRTLLLLQIFRFQEMKKAIAMKRITIDWADNGELGD